MGRLRCLVMINKDEKVFGYSGIRRHICVKNASTNDSFFFLSFFLNDLIVILNVNGTNGMRISDDSDIIFTGPVTDSGVPPIPL